MPMYDYKCESCGKEFVELRKIDLRNEPVLCKCGGIAPKVISLTQLDPWKPVTLEHVESKPRTFETRKELTAYCKKRKISSSMLL